jgi:hypothetical protein
VLSRTHHSPRILYPMKEVLILISHPFKVNFNIILRSGVRGSVVVKALCYKPEGRGFSSRLGHWIFSIDLILPAALGPGVYSASNRNEYQELIK